VHADIILAEDPLDYAPLFVELADAFYEKDMFEEARPIYELLGSSAEVSPILWFIVLHHELASELRQAVSIFSSKLHHA